MRKKEIFQKIKKDGYEFYTTFAEMRKYLNVSAFSLDGVFVHNPYCCSRLCHISGISDARLFAQFLWELRDLDMGMQIQSRHQDKPDIWVAFYIYDENINDIYQKFGQLEQKLDVMCSACKYDFCICDFDKRMRYTFSELISGVREVSNMELSCPDTFFSENVSWMQELQPDSWYDWFSENTYRNFFGEASRKDSYYKICYLRSVTELKRPELYSSVFQNNYIRSVGIAVVPVSDFGQSVRFQNTYLDHEAAYARMRRKEDPRIDTLTHFSENGDSREYLLYGCIFVINGASPEKVNELYGHMKMQMKKSGADLDEIYGAGVFGRFLCALPAGINIQTYPLRQVHRKQIEAAAFSFYSYKKNRYSDSQEKNVGKWLNDVIV